MVVIQFFFHASWTYQNFRFRDILLAKSFCKLRIRASLFTSLTAGSTMFEDLFRVQVTDNRSWRLHISRISEMAYSHEALKSWPTTQLGVLHGLLKLFNPLQWSFLSLPRNNGYWNFHFLLEEPQQGCRKRCAGRPQTKIKQG